MIDLTQARVLALEHLHRPLPSQYPGDPAAFVILVDQTLEKTYGRVFFYDSARHQQTGDPGDMLGGNAPLLVTREGEVHVLGTALPVDHYLEWYERTGRASPPHERETWRVRVTGWREGLQKVSMTRTLRSRLGLGLAAAKAITDRVLDGEEVVLDPLGALAALVLRDELDRLGADAVAEPCGESSAGGEGR